jgi:hypothetical protein
MIEDDLTHGSGGWEIQEHGAIYCGGLAAS